MNGLLRFGIPTLLVLGLVRWLVSGLDGRAAESRTGFALMPAAAQAEQTEPSRKLQPANLGYHGMSWQIHYAPDSVDKAKVLLREIAELGADTVLIGNAGYQEHAGSKSFQIDPKVTPSKEQWLEIFRIAHDNGLRVILMPIILLSSPRGNEWRGVINPPSWDDWFEQYRKFLLYFARIAAEGKVEILMVGSELVSTEKYTEQWRTVIKEARKAFPGKLSYSANWDHYKVIEFWDDLDLVGMTSYYKLSSEPNPRLPDLIEAWKPIRRGLLRWQEKIGKPLLFTEAGWCSQEGTSIEPWNYYRSSTATPAGLEEQRNCYRAFMEVWKDDIWPTEFSESPVVGGVLWWEWNETPGGKNDYNYTPRGKPAQEELERWFKQIGDRRTSAKTAQ